MVNWVTANLDVSCDFEDLRREGAIPPTPTPHPPGVGSGHSAISQLARWPPIKS